MIADAPDGRNINDGCGSTHVEALAERVVAGGHALGFAFDGDGDRVLAVDRQGQVVDGDELLALAALHLRASGRLSGDGVAVTVMTNYGFHSAMERPGVDGRDDERRRPLRARGAARARLGARRRAVRAHHRDGLQPHRRRHRERAADARGARGRRPERARRDGEAAAAARQRARARPRGAGAAPTASSRRSRAAEQELAGRGRVLVRPSGTEPLVRVMVEAPTEEEAHEVCERLVALVQAELG